MQAYFDNSATTACDPAVVELMNDIYTEHWGNPSAMHAKGVDAEGIVRKAKEQIAKTLKCDRDEIVFTSGGTESNNLAIMGGAFANPRKGRHIITSAVEHPSVSNVFHHMEDLGYETTYIPVDPTGCLRMDILERSVRADTVLVSVMHVNNEIGALNDIARVGKIVKSKDPNILFHVDAVQSYGKLQIRPKNANVDMLSVSAHKIHGPKGVGFLYVKKGTRLSPVIYGGGQQDGIRSGTENVPGIAGLGLAAELINTSLEEKTRRMYELRERFIKGLADIEGVSVNGPMGCEGAPHIVSVSVDGIKAEVLLHALEEKDIYVSAGSACSTHKRTKSATLTAIGVEPRLLDSTVRFSFCVDTAIDETDYALDVMRQIIPVLRQFTAR